MVRKGGIFLLLEFFYAALQHTMALSAGLELTSLQSTTDTLATASSTVTQIPSSTISSSNTTDLFGYQCDYCFNVVPVSIVGIVSQWAVDGMFSRISTGEATSTGTLTEEIGTLTLYKDRMEGRFSTTAIFYQPGITTAFPDLDPNGLYQYSYITTLSTIALDYTSWHGFLFSNACVQTPYASADIIPAITFFDGELDFVQETIFGLPFTVIILPSEIHTGLPIPTCTSFELPTTVRTIPKLMTVAETGLTDPDPSTFDARVPLSTEIALGVVFVISIGLALGFLAFFLWRRCRKEQQMRPVPATWSKSDPTNPQNRSSYHKMQEMFMMNLSRSKGKTWRNYWRAPLVMFGGLLMGLAFALGHHFLYAMINMEPVDDVHLSQAWVIRFGTLLALLTRLSLAITVGTSFVQLQWLKLRLKPRSVRDIDVLSSITTHPFGCFDTVFLRYQSLALLVVILWLLLLLPVLTPGTCNIRSLAHQQKTPLIVPQFPSKIDSTMEAWGTPSFDHYGNPLSFTPSASLTQIYVPAAFKAEISSIMPLNPNQTYHLNFHGPAVNCSEAQESVTISMTTIFGVSMNGLDLNGADGSDHYPIWYSWVPGDENWWKGTNPPKNIDFTSQDAARLFLLHPIAAGPAPNITIEGGGFWLPKVIECSLYNASYSVDFSFLNSQQTLSTNISFLNTVPILASLDGKDVIPGRLFEPSYAALMAGLGNLLIGKISNVTGVGGVDGSNASTSGPITNYTQAQSLSQIFLDGVHMSDRISQNIEEMFQNMTLSVVTSAKPLLTIDQTVTGVVTNYLSTYTYDSIGLTLAYCIAFLLSLFSAVVGFYAFTKNDGSYQNIFSTFLRATKDTKLVIEDEDEGADPCPKALSRAKVKVTPGISEIDAWIQSPIERHLLVKEPEISHSPTMWQQEQLRQRYSHGFNKNDKEVILEEVELDQEQEMYQITWDGLAIHQRR